MKSDNAYNVPAIVVGGGLNGLGVIRSLARAGVSVAVLDSNREGPAMYTRYARKIVDPDAGSDAVVEALQRIGRNFSAAGLRPVLFLTQEFTVSAVSRRRDELLPFFHITLPPPMVLTALLHKKGFHAVAEAAGAVVPKTLHITKEEEVDLISELRPPLVIKPSFHDPSFARMFRKAYRLDTVAEAQSLVRQILGVLPDVVVQQWIEGSDSDIYFCLQYVQRDGNPAASFVGRKIRSWPPRVGGTASCTAVRDSGHLNQVTTQFFRHARVVGFASMEYKRDPRSGVFFMVEPTVGRTDYQEEVATLNGVNIPLAAYRAELGLPPLPCVHKTMPRIWRDRPADQQAAMQRPDDSGADALKAGRVVDAFWRAYDPMPATALLLKRICARGRRAMLGSTHRREDKKDPARC